MKKLNSNKWLNFSAFSVRLIYFMLAIIVLIVVLVVKPTTLYIDLLLILAIVIICICMCIREVKYKNTRIMEMSNSLTSTLTNSFELIKIPMLIVADNGKILWKNNVLKYEISDDEVQESILKIQSKSNQNLEMKDFFENGDRSYTVIGNKITLSDIEGILISYINTSEESKLKNILKDTKLAVGIVFVDNYEETMQGLDDIEKADISSRIGKEISNYIKEHEGIAIKVEKDRFIIFIEKKYLDKMEDENFYILENIRNITDKTKLPVTISVGISYQEEILDGKYMASSSALDIALGRGGDQVVIKKGNEYVFYGGANLGLEKTSRVRARTISQALNELIQKSDKVYIMGHNNTDIDCIGAAVGVYKIAKSCQKQTTIIIDSKCNSSTQNLIEKLLVQEEYKDVFVSKDDLKKQDFSDSLLIIVDTHKKSYVSYPELVDEFEKIVVIDHHRRGAEFIDNALLTYHELYASSACELVTELLMYSENVELTPNEAECIYAGIVIDTKNFLFKTGVRTFEVAAYLKKFGIDLTEVKQLFQNDFNTYISKVDIVRNAEIIKGRIAISVTEQQSDDMPIIAAQAADELLSISGILASFVLSRVDDVVMISGRSLGDINVQSIMEKIGGGGHLTFAGAQISNVTLEEAKEKLILSIDDYLDKEV